MSWERFNDQFRETEYERNARLRAKRLAKADAAKLDPRDPDHSREGIFVYHDCSRCLDGKRPCVKGNPRQCEYPRARND